MKSVPRLNVPDDIVERLITSEVATYSNDAINRYAAASMLRMELQSPEIFAEVYAEAEVIALEVETAVKESLREMEEGQTISLEDYIAEVMAKRRQWDAKKN